MTRLITATAASAAPTSAVQTVPGTGDAYRELDVAMAVTAATGGTTPAVQCEIQWSHDSSTFFSVDTTKQQFPDNTNTGLQAGASAIISFPIKARYWRAVTSYSGTPTNMTFTVDYDYSS